MIKWIKAWRAEQKQREHDREWGRGYRAMERVMKRDVQEAAEWFSHAKVATKFEGWNPFDAGVIEAWDGRAAVTRRIELDMRLALMLGALSSNSPSHKVPVIDQLQEAVGAVVRRRDEMKRELEGHREGREKLIAMYTPYRHAVDALLEIVRLANEGGVFDARWLRAIYQAREEVRAVAHAEYVELCPFEKNVGRITHYKGVRL